MVGIWIKTWKRRYFENPSDRETFLSDWMKLINSHDESLSDEAWRLFEVQSKEFGCHSKRILAVHGLKNTDTLGIESPHQSLGRSLSAKKNISHGDFLLVRGRSNLPGQ